MEWYQYIASFFASAFLANVVPHFVHGVSGDKFPTPFAKPPGKGLSSAPVNMVWALFNLLIGYLLLKPGGVSPANTPSMAVFFIGIAAVSIMASINFQKKDKE
jgi:hypothetical protein